MQSSTVQLWNNNTLRVGRAKEDLPCPEPRTRADERELAAWSPERAVIRWMAKAGILFLNAFTLLREGECIAAEPD